MNRSLVIPAACCLFAFAVMLAALHGVGGWETATQPAQSGAPSRLGDRGTKPITRAYSASEVHDGRLLSSEEAEQVLSTLAGEYLRPWRQWETSPRRLYSRAAPRPIPTISAKIELSQVATGQSDSFLVAVITVSKGAQSQPVPCVVDRITQEVRLFSEGQWLSKDEWLKKAPLPQSAKP